MNLFFHYQKHQKKTSLGLKEKFKQAASIYDLLGWISPATLIAKEFIQKLWKSQLPWDTLLPKELSQEWKSILANWKMKQIRMPRNFGFDDLGNTQFQLHVFTDASKTAYSAVAYLLSHETNHQPKIRLLLAKSRLSPIRKIPTIPRLELSAITIGAILVKYLQSQLDISICKSYIWSDSKVALMWTKCDKALPVFIRNRVESIQANAPTSEPRYVLGDQNPDIGSRGMTLENLLKSDLWFNGPSFLLQSEKKWPDDVSHIYDSADDAEESFLVEENTSPTHEPLFQEERFSSWTKLLNTIFIVLLFIIEKSQKASRHFSNQSSQVLATAEIIICRQVQLTHPPADTIKNQLHLYYCEKTRL
ncbi:Pao retrotransposon peptidase [Ancylostoma ceylanicum]|uniref:Pao retrotransposon peptidase n=2 Tax=Ancylostoma ceylanicum TaxID=53326 RepID=A0A0D6L7L2_9BILA|nr:Pao retrotransposon peptidase [Ancylostoma ceylanicum]EYC42698.1 hypothetical protein Y032_0521g2868 [Ancylostoma ceylanicum]